MNTRWSLGIEYDGSAFHGFQRQRHEPRTVQAALEQALSFVAAEPIAIICAGRTDTGVHATAQVVHFDTAAERPAGAWVRGGNSRSAEGVVIRWAHSVGAEFHARFSARSRRYLYIMCDAQEPYALRRNYVSHTRGALNVERMQTAARALIGEHDFSSFRAAGCQARSPVRSIFQFRVWRTGDCVFFEVSANAFLQHMVRNIVGTLCQVGSGVLPVVAIGEILAQRDRRVAGPSASANGLYLTQVTYDRDYGFPTAARAPWFVVGDAGEHAADW